MSHQKRCSTAPEPDPVAIVLGIGIVVLLGAAVVLIASSASGGIARFVAYLLCGCVK
jgi:hypothetical protein